MHFVSADFVSGDYLKNLAAEKIADVSKYRRKLTNAIEVPDNVYTNFYGQRTTYHKVWEITGGESLIYFEGVRLEPHKRQDMER